MLHVDQDPLSPDGMLAGALEDGTPTLPYCHSCIVQILACVKQEPSGMIWICEDLVFWFSVVRSKEIVPKRSCEAPVVVRVSVMDQVVPLHPLEPPALGVPVVAAVVAYAIQDVAQPIEAHHHPQHGCAEGQRQQGKGGHYDDGRQVPGDANERLRILMMQSMSHAQERVPLMVDVAMKQVLGQRPRKQSGQCQEGNPCDPHAKLPLMPRVRNQPCD